MTMIAECWAEVVLRLPYLLDQDVPVLEVDVHVFPGNGIGP